MLIQDPPVALNDEFWMLGTTGYPLYLCCSLSQGAIFEGGTGAMDPLLLAQLEQLGIGRETVKQVVVTHAHPDHVMAVPLFRQMFPGVSVVASEVAARTLAAEKAVAMFRQIDQSLTDAMLKLGWVGEEHRPAALAENCIAVDRTVKEGDAIEVDGGTFEVLETPGHSECSLSFHEPRRKILIISDATGYYLPEQNAWWPCYFSDYGAYLASIRRLAEIEAETLCLSHNGAIRGREAIRDYFQGAIAATEQYHGRIIEASRAGQAPRQIAEELGREAHAQAPLLPVEFFQKNCALLVKHSLRHEGMTAA